MIEVYGKAILRADFYVELAMTEDEFEALTESQQDALIDSKIDWQDATKSAEVDEFDVWEFREIQKNDRPARRP